MKQVLWIFFVLFFGLCISVSWQEQEIDNSSSFNCLNRLLVWPPALSQHLNKCLMSLFALSKVLQAISTAFWTQIIESSFIILKSLKCTLPVYSTVQSNTILYNAAVSKKIWFNFMKYFPSLQAHKISLCIMHKYFRQVQSNKILTQTVFTLTKINM